MAQKTYEKTPKFQSKTPFPTLSGVTVCIHTIHIHNKRYKWKFLGWRETNNKIYI